MYAIPVVLIWRRPTGILQAIIKCYCLRNSLLVRLTFTFSINPLCSNTKFCSLYSRQGMAWNGMKDDFSIFHTGNFLPFHTKNFPFHSILKFSSIFHSILPYQRNFRLEAMQRLQCCKQPLVKVRQQH